MADSTNWTSRPVEAATNYVSELASDIWHGEAMEKHPTAMAVGAAAVLAIGAGTAFGALRRLGAAAEEFAAGGESLTAAGRIFPSMPGSVAGTTDAVALADQAATVKGIMPPALYEKVMSSPGTEYATRTTPAKPPWDVNIVSKDPGTRQALMTQMSDLRAMGQRTGMTADGYANDLLKSSTKAGWADDQTLIARTYAGYGRISDVIVRLDQNAAVEQVLKANRIGQTHLAETRIYDFSSGEARSYLFTGRNGVLRSTVARGTAQGSWLSEDQATAEFMPTTTALFNTSAKGKDITGYHHLLSQI